MWLGKSGDLELSGRTRLRSEYIESEGGAGRLHVEHVASSYDTTGNAAWDLDPWAPEGFLVYEWVPGQTCVVCAATRILVIDIRTLAVCGVIPIECDEFRIRSTPWFAASDELLLIASESRVVCVDRRIAIRWFWSNARTRSIRG